jgi:hypothetical protein
MGAEMCLCVPPEAGSQSRFELDQEAYGTCEG